jgi:hypothetical protein
VKSRHAAALAFVGWYLMASPLAATLANAKSELSTYTNQTYGFSFRYPSDWTLKEGDQVKLDWGYLGPVRDSLPRGAIVAAVVFPFDRSAPTGWTTPTQFMKVSVDTSLTSVECNRSAFHGLEEIQAEPGKFPTPKVGAIQFTEAQEYNAGAGHKAFARYYHVFQDRTCYEFQLGLNEDLGSPDEIEDGFSELKTILATVTIRPAIIAPHSDTSVRQ